jgi:hypothetical protein
MIEMFETIVSWGMFLYCVWIILIGFNRAGL